MDIGPNEVRLTPVSPQATFSGPATLNGTVRSAAGPGIPLTIEVAGERGRLELVANVVVVKRNGEPAKLSDLQPGDAVTLQVGPGLVVQQIKRAALQERGRPRPRISSSERLPFDRAAR